LARKTEKEKESEPGKASGQQARGRQHERNPDALSKPSRGLLMTAAKDEARAVVASWVRGGWEEGQRKEDRPKGARERRGL
jgi:hypothetical protein